MSDSKRPRGATRRDFLKTTSAAAGAAAGVAAGAAAGTTVGVTGCKRSTRSGDGRTQADSTDPRGGSKDPREDGPRRRMARPQPRKTGRSKVVVVRDAQVLDDRGRVRAKVLAKMVDRGVTRLTGADDARAAWQSLLDPKDVLGIKSNVWRYLRTPPALEAHLKRSARRVGIPADAIHVDDRSAKRTLSDSTALINARPLRSHHWAGIGGCLKNYIMFVDRPWDYHDDSCADLGALWNLPSVKGKTRLNILVMLTPLFHGRGPHHFNRKYLWPYQGVVLSQDPVAADRVGLEILRAKRKDFFGEPRPFAVRTVHVGYADTRHGVGVADLDRIDITLLGDKGGALLPG
jgi:hypothetical protein